MFLRKFENIFFFVVDMNLFFGLMVLTFTLKRAMSKIFFKNCLKKVNCMLKVGPSYQKQQLATAWHLLHTGKY